MAVVPDSNRIPFCIYSADSLSNRIFSYRIRFFVIIAPCPAFFNRKKRIASKIALFGKGKADTAVVRVRPQGARAARLPFGQGAAAVIGGAFDRIVVLMSCKGAGDAAVVRF